MRSKSPNKTTSYFAGKPYSEFPVPVDRKSFQRSGLKYRNPGLMNVHRSIDMNKYQHYQQQSQSSLIRKLGDTYQRKLNKLYNTQNISYSKNPLKNLSSKNAYSSHHKNQQQQIKGWYRERMTALQSFYQEYMIKIQNELQDKQMSSIERAQLLNQMNKSWQEQIPMKIKQCFQ